MGRRELQKVGLDFIGCTPCMSQFLAQRPTEIMTWKRENAKGPSAQPVSHWVAIDDRDLLLERHVSYLRGHFAQTHPLRGLTDDVADECIKILSREAPPRKGDEDHLEVNSSTLRPQQIAPTDRSRRGASTSATGKSQLMEGDTSQCRRRRSAGSSVPLGRSRVGPLTRFCAILMSHWGVPEECDVDAEMCFKHF